MIQSILAKVQAIHAKIATPLADVFLLLVRVQWGWGFFQTGLGKFKNFDRTVEFFSSLGIPLPEVNAIMAAGTEMVGGALLLLGWGSKIVPIPLIITMVVAYLTAHTDELASLKLFPEIDPFLTAPPFLFLMAALIVFLFGPGRISLDHILGKRMSK